MAKFKICVDEYDHVECTHLKHGNNINVIFYTYIDISKKKKECVDYLNNLHYPALAL